MGMKRTPRFILLTVGYGAVAQGCFALALLLRFEGSIPARYVQGWLLVLPWFTALSLLAYLVAGLYHGLWRYASTVTLFQVFKGATLSALGLGMIDLFSRDPLFPRSIIPMVWVWQIVVLGAMRFAWRLSRERVLGPITSSRAVRTLVVGADPTGVHLIQEMRRGSDGPENLVPVGFIDDDPRLTGGLVEGVKVRGTIADLPRIIQDARAEMVVVSDADMPAKVVREIARFCGEAHVRIKTLPGLSDMQHGRTALSQMRDVRIEDLLGRQPVQLNLGEVAEFLRGQRILVTGAGGSIGSELARQVAGFEPAELVLLDHAENGLYYVHNELVALHPALRLHAVVADIQDAAGMELAFQRFRPHVVFHAAAHKHVPLLEISPREAVLNNILGTRNLVRASDHHGVGKFVLISTDKAVNPTSVMGASKRVCEMMLQSHAQKSRTMFVAVRFGNVLGSDGSVIPLFQKQIARGGPLTVTHPEARRYFMTIPEAVRLVLQAGAIGRSGEVLLLDMGEQVRIVDLARQLIRMSGMREGDDIEIRFTGLRPGEKLYEELHSDEERTRLTRHDRILVWDLDAPDEAELMREVDELVARSRRGEPEAIKLQLHRIVPEYAEPQLDPLVPSPAASPVVELPMASKTERAPAAAREWPDVVRGVVEATVATLLIAVTSPLWVLLALEARRRGERDFLVSETRIGMTRRRGQRRTTRQPAPIDRRSIERRTQDLLGAPIRCARFRTDLGPLGRWIAARRLDKLPFLLNVLRGEMALVGPKPEKEELVLRWAGVVPDYARRFSVLPGVTGLAQVSNCSDSDADGVVRRVQYDLYYIDHRSLLLDLRTLVRTVRVVLMRPRRFAQPAPGSVPSGAAVKGVTQ
jgi:FlaA1/EpsC-like NDP-sugar epimerase/lipopolysaccharide/colanic/teichoic acid biosynthesis glycosyltransferase